MCYAVLKAVRKWLGMPLCLCTVALHGKGILELAMSRLVEDLNCAKRSLKMTYSQSKDPAVKSTAPSVNTGKWNVNMHRAQGTLQHRDITGHVQNGRAMFALGEWGKTTLPEWRQMGTNFVCEQEEETR